MAEQRSRICCWHFLGVKLAHLAVCIAATVEVITLTPLIIIILTIDDFYYILSRIPAFIGNQ